MSGNKSARTDSRSTRTSPAEASENTNLHPPRRDGEPSVEAIQARAYALWEEAGCPSCDGSEFWLRAEQELKNPR